jgi:hypothetical protein
LNATEKDHPFVGSSQLRLYANINETLFISLIDLILLYPLTIILTSPSNLLPTFSVGQQILLDGEAYLLLYPVLVTLDLVASGWVEALPWAVQTVEYGYTTALSETVLHLDIVDNSDRLVRFSFCPFLNGSGLRDRLMPSMRPRQPPSEPMRAIWPPRSRLNQR